MKKVLFSCASIISILSNQTTFAHIPEPLQNPQAIAGQPSIQMAQVEQTDGTMPKQGPPSTPSSSALVTDESDLILRLASVLALDLLTSDAPLTAHEKKAYVFAGIRNGVDALLVLRSPRELTEEERSALVRTIQKDPSSTSYIASEALTSPRKFTMFEIDLLLPLIKKASHALNVLKSNLDLTEEMTANLAQVIAGETISPQDDIGYKHIAYIAYEALIQPRPFASETIKTLVSVIKKSYYFLEVIKKSYYFLDSEALYLLRSNLEFTEEDKEFLLSRLQLPESVSLVIQSNRSLTSAQKKMALINLGPYGAAEALASFAGLNDFDRTDIAARLDDHRRLGWFERRQRHWFWDVFWAIY